MITDLAFPCAGTEGVNPESLGMMLRDYFACHASEEDIREHQAPWTTKNTNNGGVWETLIPDCSRETAKFRYADAMMQARRSK